MRGKRFLEVAARYRPKGVKVRFARAKSNLLEQSAHAMIKQDGTREILTPRPDTREGLAFFLHECAHFALGHVRLSYSEMPRWQMEWEAEMWSMATMRREGISVPQSVIKAAKTYVRRCIKKRLVGQPLPPLRVRRWCNYRRKS